VKNIVSEMKNILDDINNRLKPAEEKTNEFED
jgi:hypothetical protein